MLDRIGLEQKRELPARNQTAGKRDYAEDYDGSESRYVARIFGPFMIEWGYPADSLFGLVSRIDILKYQAAKPVFQSWRIRPSENCDIPVLKFFQ